MEFCPKRHAINFQNPAGEAFDDPGLGGTMLTNTTEIGTATLPRRRLTIPAPTDVSPSAPRRPPRFPALAQFASAARRVPRAPIPVAFALAVLAVLATVAPEPAAAQTVTTFISNTGQTGTTASLVRATEFTTGTGTYTLSSVGIYLDGVPSGTTTPVVQIYGDSGGNPGSTLLATMTNPGTFAANAVNIFTAPANTTLSASTTYWVVTSNSATTNGAGFIVGVVGNTTLDSGTAAGWSIGAARFKNDINDASWSGGNSFRIRFAIRGTGGTTTNNPPTVANTIPDQTATVGTAFSYAFPDTTFTDADTGDTLTYTATKADDTALPLWLAFAASTRTFSGTPTDAGTVAVKVTASDGNGGSVSDTFDITVAADPNAHCNVLDTSELWCGTLTVGVLHVAYGYNAGHSYGSVAPLTFTHGGATITVNGLFYVGTRLQFSMSSALGAGDFSLEIGTGGAKRSFAMNNPGIEADFFNHGLSWSANETVPVKLLLVNTPATGAPAITGTAQVGQTLTATLGDIADVDGLPDPFLTDANTSFQWIRVATDNSETDIGAMAGAYTLVADDQGTTIKVKVSFTGNNGFAETLTSAATAAVSAAATAAVVPADWSLKPTAVAAGAKFRLLFLSSTTSGDSSTDIATYNTFVQTRAAAGHADIRDYSAGFRAVGCTAAVDARDNTATTYTTTDKGVPIYWLNGAKAADQYEDFYDGSWDDEANDKNESGTDAHDTSVSTNYPITGCNHDGTESFTGSTSLALGANRVRSGGLNSSVSDVGPLHHENSATTGSVTRPMYGLSAVFQVAAAVVVPNNPPTVANAIPDQSATAGTAFSYVFPDTTFSDADTSDTLTYTATKADDTALPTWLAFAAGTRTFSGTPQAADTGTVAVKVTASDGNGGSVSDAFDITVSAIVPGAPSALSATAIGSTQIDLSWSAPASTGGSAITGYKIEVSPNGTSSWTNLVANTNSTATTYAHTGLASGDTRHYRVSAINANGAGTASNVDSATTDAVPGAVSDVVVVPVPRTTDSLTVSWSAPDNAGKPALTGYDVRYRSSGGGGSWTTVSEDAPSTSLIIGGLRDAFYDVQVRALNADYSGPWSSTAEGVTSPDPERVYANHPLIPDDLGPGDSFRLLFITGATTAATGTGIHTYHNFAQTAVIAIVNPGNLMRAWGPVSLLQTALVSTPGADARLLTDTSWTETDRGMPIYWLNGARVADDYADFYDGTWADEANPTNEIGEPHSLAGNAPWTGTDHDGTELFNGTASRAIGQASVSVGGLGSTITGAGPLNGGVIFASSEERPIYGLWHVMVVDENLRLINNYDQPGSVSDDSDSRAAVRAQLFTTGPNSSGYGIGGIAFVNGSDIDRFLGTVALYTTDTDGDPDLANGLHATLSLERAHEFSWELAAPAGTVLKPNTTYALVLQGDGGTYPELWTIAADGENVPADGWSLADTLLYHNGTSWVEDSNGRSLMIEIVGRQLETEGPALVSATVGAAGNAVTLVFDEDVVLPSDSAEALTFLASLASAFAVTADGAGVAVSGLTAASDDSDQLTIVLSGVILQGQAVTLTYTDPTAGDDAVALQDVLGNETPTFTTGLNDVPAVINNSTITVLTTTVPGAPTGLTATASGTTAINLSWSAPASTGGSAITGYKIEVSPNGTSGWTDQVANTNSTATTYAHTGLAAGTTRYYRVSAINANGAGVPSNVDSATSATTATTVPGAPTGLAATASGTTAIDLSWSAPASTGGSAITGYKIEVSPDGTSGWTDQVADTNSTATTYAHTGLTPGTTRHYRVSAINANGTGTASNVDSTTTGTSAPGAPTGLAATASGTTAIDLSWSAPASTGGSAITGYKIEVSPNGTSGWTDQVADTSSTATTYAHTGLTPGDTRHYRVSAINTNGAGTASNVDSATTGTTVPGAPTGLTAMASGTTAIDLSWSAPASTGGSAITGYKIESSSDGGSSWSDLVANTSNTTTTYAHTGLTPGTTRHFRVSAINANGTGLPSNVDSATTDATAPGAPTGLTATASETTAIDLSWSAPASTGGSAITGYKIEVSPDGTSGWTDQVADTNSTATTYAHTGLTAGTTRHYRVSAINTQGTGTPSNVDSATTGATVPGAPTGLTATASGTTAIDLSWSAPASTGGSAITGYKIEVSPDGTSGWTDQVADTNSTATTYAHTGLAAGTTRHYRVSAINTNGTGTPSNVDSATTGTTVPGAPTGLAATASGTTAIDLSWSAPASTGGSAITGYKIEVSPDGTSGWTDQVADTSSTATTYAHTGLSAGTTRHYRVSAINTQGTGTPSNVDSATTGQTTVTFGASSYTATEGGAAATVTVALSAAPSASVTIPLTTAHLNGATAADHAGIPATVTFGTNQTVMTFTVTATDDADTDGGESVQLGFGTLPGGYAPGARRTATVTLVDDDANLIVNFGTERHTTVKVLESDTVWHRFIFSLSTRSWGPPNGNPQQPVTIPLVVTHVGGAKAEEDYEVRGRRTLTSVTFGVGESVTDFSMRAIPDGKREPGEGLRLDFGPLPAGVRKGTWGPYETIAFVDQELPGYTVLFGAEAYTATEGGAPARVSIHLSEPVEIEPLVVGLVVTHVGATAADYTGIPKSVRFGVGEQTQTITVTATDDTDDDDGESVTLSFVNDPNGRVRVGTGPASATVALADNDGTRRVTVSFGAVTYTATEGGADATVRVELDAAPGRSVTVPLTKAHLGNATAADYSGIPMNVTFAANQTSRTFAVMATAGDGSDGGESVSIGFGTLPEGVFAGSPAATTVTLADGGEQRLVVNFGSSRGHTVQVREGARRLRLNVLLDSSPRRPVTIPLVVTHVGGATEADYAAIPESVTFAAGQTSAHYYVRALPDEEDKTGEGLQLDFGTLPPGVRKGTWGPYETIDFLDPAPAALLPAFAAFRLLTSGNASAQDSVESDRAVLVALYNATDGPNWTGNTHWLSNEPLSEWRGVGVNDDGRVTALWLFGNQLTGEIPVELSQLSQLQLLYLSSNQLTGEIPVELSQLSQLQDLSLDSNQLTGEIPVELSQLSQLQLLYLYSNRLTGEIPAELGDLAQLTGLYLHGNELNGPIPSWLVNLTELRELSLWSNQLTGTIPPEVAPAQDRAALVVLYLQTDGPNWTDNTNWARSREPLSEWHGVSTDEQGRVEELRLSANGSNGTIGAELGVLTRLAGLYLNDNELTGTIPPELENLTQLQVFDIRNTGLCVTADSELHPWIATIQDFQGTATCGASNLVANFSNGNNGAFNSRVYLWNPSGSSGDVTVRVFTLPLTGGLAQELTTAPLNLGTLGAKSALNVKVAEDILAPLGITLPYTNNEGDLTLEFTIQAVDVRGATQVFSSSLAFGAHPLQEIPSASSGSPTVLVANFMNGNSDAFSSRAYLFNPSDSDGTVTVRVFTLPLSDGTAQELTGTPLDLGTLEARSALNLKLAEDILTPLGITTPYTTDGGNLTLEFTIQAADARGAAQVFSSSFAFGVYPLQEIPSTSSGSPTVLVANFMNGNSDAFSSRAYLFNPSDSDGTVTVRVFTLPLSDGTAQELTGTPLDLGTLEARSALNLKLVEDILIPLGIALPYTTDGGNLTLEFTIQAADARGAAQVFSSDFAFGTYPMQEIPSTSSGSPTVLVANFVNGNDAALNSRVYLWNPSLSAGSVTVRVFTLPLTAGVAQELTSTPLDLGTLGAESARNLKLVEDILTPLGIPTPYVTDGGNLTLEFTIQAADVRGAAQVFSSSFAFGTVPLQVIR